MGKFSIWTFSSVFSTIAKQAFQKNLEKWKEGLFSCELKKKKKILKHRTAITQTFTDG